MMKARKFVKLQKKYTQNLTRCKIVKSKSDACLKSCFKISRVVKKVDLKSDETKFLLDKIMLFTKILIQNRAFHKKFWFKFVLF